MPKFTPKSHTNWGIEVSKHDTAENLVYNTNGLFTKEKV
jgi:hypothetical protein